MLPAKTINAMAVADFNNNGLLDIFICSYHDINERDVDSYLYWNRDGRGFSATDRTRLFTHSASGCVAADLNENGWTDLGDCLSQSMGRPRWALGHLVEWPRWVRRGTGDDAAHVGPARDDVGRTGKYRGPRCGGVLFVGPIQAA